MVLPHPDSPTTSTLRAPSRSHSFASRAPALGESLPKIGKLLGHRHIQTTARYTYLGRDSVHESLRRVSESVEASLYRDCPEMAAARR